MRTLPRAVAIAACISALAACHKTPHRGRIPIRVDHDGFTPLWIQLDRGAPATLVFTRTTDDTCAKKVVFPELELIKPLPLHEPVDVDIPTSAPRKLTFRCGMGMFSGSVVVE